MTHCTETPDVTLEPFDAQHHDARLVARLIYQADPALMSFVFGDEHKSAERLAALVGMEHNDYAGRRIICALCDGSVVGVLAGLTGAERASSAKSAGQEWPLALGLGGTLRAIRWSSRLESVATQDVAASEYYISALSVDEARRGNGIGSALLGEVLDRQDVVVADVNIAKSDPIRFYQRHGFEIAETMTFRHKGQVFGNHQMRREREQR